MIVGQLMLLSWDPYIIRPVILSHHSQQSVIGLSRTAVITWLAVIWDTCYLRQHCESDSVSNHYLHVHRLHMVSIHSTVLHASPLSMRRDSDSTLSVSRLSWFKAVSAEDYGYINVPQSTATPHWWQAWQGTCSTADSVLHYSYSPL